MLSRPVDGGIPVFNYLFLSALHNFETCKIKQKKIIPVKLLAHRVGSFTVLYLENSNMDFLLLT
jgi:hypothetical protein